jgi:hypothetical protein
VKTITIEIADERWEEVLNLMAITDYELEDFTVVGIRTVALAMKIAASFAEFKEVSIVPVGVNIAFDITGCEIEKRIKEYCK